MAGRYLLIEFDDEASAERLRAQINQATRNGKGFRVVGLFARPGPAFCGCGTWTTERGRPATTKIGRKFGWAVCTVCRKPAPIMSFLRNILRPIDIIDPPLYSVSRPGHSAQDIGFHFLGISAPSLGAKGFEE